MKKVLSFTLVSLALAALAAPAQAQFGGSIRGDVGMLGNQVPYLTVTHGIPVVTPVFSETFLSHRKDGQWDFTGRLFVYTSCAPCSTYVAASWQGSNQTVHTHEDWVTASDLLAFLPLRVNLLDELISVNVGSPFTAEVAVRNKFSKAKLGMGFELIKCNCFAFTMEVGGNYLNAQLDVDRPMTITQTIAQGVGELLLPGGLAPIISGPLTLVGEVLDLVLPFDYVLNQNTHQKTEGVGLYASFKAEYKFPSSCFGNCFGIYGKAEVADIIGRQSYSDSLAYTNFFSNSSIIPGVVVPVLLPTPANYIYENVLNNRYNNIVEVDLEAALVYTPCFKCWENLNLNFALGVRTDSFVNLFSQPTSLTSQSFTSLTRPTVFLELGIKV